MSISKRAGYITIENEIEICEQEPNCTKSPLCTKEIIEVESLIELFAPSIS